ncbi:MAG: ribosome recycling factor [Armatimonadetes bacterium]|nr:ribosome recycling factor [Candidatus Hippobium faecium]
MSKEIITNAENKMKSAVEFAKADFDTLRTGKANAKMLDGLMVEYYGTPTPVNQIAGVSVPEPSQLIIKPYDPSCLKDIEKAILNSDLNMNPNNDGAIIRLNVPPLNEERRKDLIKQLMKKAEEHKVAIRNVRRDANDKLKAEQKKALITEDDLKRENDQIQKLTDKYIKDIDTAAAAKEKDLKTI